MKTSDPRGHERSDISYRGAALLTAGIVVATALAIVLTYFLFGYFAARETRNQPSLTTLVATEDRPLPPEPRLQPNPVEELHEQRAVEQEALHGYAWVDRAAGRVRIPVTRALDLVAERGLPATAAPGPAGGGAP